MYFISIATAAAVVDWIVICITHIKFRQYCEREGHETSFRSILYPWTNYLSLAFLLGVVFMMTQIPDMQMAVVITPVWLFVLWLGYKYKNK